MYINFYHTRLLMQIPLPWDALASLSGGAIHNVGHSGGTLLREGTKQNNVSNPTCDSRRPSFLYWPKKIQKISWTLPTIFFTPSLPFARLRDRSTQGKRDHPNATTYVHFGDMAAWRLPTPKLRPLRTFCISRETPEECLRIDSRCRC